MKSVSPKTCVVRLENRNGQTRGTGFVVHSNLAVTCAHVVDACMSGPGMRVHLTFEIGDEVVTVTKSCLVFVPAGLEHSPILVPKLERPIIHFSGGNGGDYIRRGSDQF